MGAMIRSALYDLDGMRSVSIQVKRKFMDKRYSLASKDPERIQRYQNIDDWIDQHFEEEIAFLQALVKVPTDTPRATMHLTPIKALPCSRRWAFMLSYTRLMAPPSRLKV